MPETLGASVPRGAARALACPSCGAAVALRAMAWTQTVACASCGAVLDAADPNLRVLQEAARRAPPAPLIPLGTRGGWRGGEVEAVGVREQEIRVEGARYAWREYVLFNPYRGFRYLVEYDGHWTSVAPLAAVPQPAVEGGRPAVRLDGTVYRHFQTATARTSWVLGEFPWEARAGDAVRAKDYVAPPFVLSAEEDAGPGGAAEVTWSRGEYVDGAEVWRAFALPGRPPAPRGVYANQPSPYPGAGPLVRLFAVFALVLVAGAFARFATAGRAVAFQQTYTYTPPVGATDSAAPFVTPSFALGPGRFGLPANVRVETDAALRNEWMAVDYALIDEGSGRAYEAARGVSRYSGVDPEDNSPWTEGSGHDAVRIGPVPAGRYFLRVAPSGGEAGAGARPIAWTLTVRRDVPSSGLFWLALLALGVPPLAAAVRAAAFEQRRWAESDYAPSPSSSGDDSGDDED